MTELPGYCDVRTKPIVTGSRPETVAPPIRLQAERTMTGRVINQRGVPVQGAEIWIYTTSQVRNQNVSTGADCKFFYRKVPPGPQHF